MTRRTPSLATLGLRRSMAAQCADHAEAVHKALGARQDPEAPGGPNLVHVSRFNTGAKRRETEIDALVRHGVLEDRHVVASQVFITLLESTEAGGRDSVEALSASIGGAPPNAWHDAQLRLVGAGDALRKVAGKLRERVGSQGAAIVMDICGGTSAAAIAVGLRFARTDRPELGDARRVHGLIRLGFDALADVVLSDGRAPRRFGERVDLGEQRTEIEIVYVATGDAT